MNIKKIFKALFLSCLFFVASAYFAIGASAAPRLYFDPNSATAQNGRGFDVTIKIDVESNNAFGADATIIFPAGDLNVRSVTIGNFFSDLVYAQNEGRLELHGYMSAAFASKTGSGDLAKITFTAKKDSGTGAISFVCTGEGETKIINLDGQNILSCSNIGNQVSLVFAGDSGLPPGYSEPNQCGGTCGSNYNCKAPLYCYNGFCRNPDCREDLTCGCKATPIPVPKKKATPKPTPKGGAATPEVIVLSEFTPFPISTPVVESPEPVSEGQAAGFDLKKAGIIAGAAILGLAIILMLISRGKRRNLPPKISPPTQGPEPTVTASNFPPPPFPPPPQNPPV